MGILQSSQDRVMLGEYLKEMFATFLFTIIVGLTTTNPRDILLPALAIGFGCSVLAESERAHMNPVISLAIAICDPKMGWTALFLRLLAQLVGCILGGLTAVDGIRDERLLFEVSTFSRVERAVIFELFFAFIMVLVVLRTRKLPSGSFAYGLCYTLAILAGEVIFSGNSFINPATAVGLMLGSSTYDSSTAESYLWIYLVAPILGALLAVIFFQFTEFLFDDDEVYDSTYTSDAIVEGTHVERVETKPTIGQQRFTQQPVRDNRTPTPDNYNRQVRRRAGEPSPETQNTGNRGGNGSALTPDVYKSPIRSGSKPVNNGFQQASAPGTRASAPGARASAPGTSYRRPMTRGVQRRYIASATNQVSGGQQLGSKRSSTAQRGLQNPVGYRDNQYEI
jgi:glycerol uptake facilitator-like aquaporin